MPRKLKVYRTAIGFHDAYVAAPSMKAALEAWGTDKNLFARGVAEQVTDPALTKAALARPGEVVRVPRGSAAEHVKALGARPKRAKPTDEDAPPKPAPRQPEKPPKPSRDQLRFAEAALAAAKARAKERLGELAARERELAAETARFEKRLAQAHKQYDKAMAAWRRG